MELLLLLLILGVFILPSFFMMRTQRRRQAELEAMQGALQYGDRIVTVSGMHGTVVGLRDTELDVELAPGVVVTMDRIAVLRPLQAPTPEVGPAESTEPNGPTVEDPGTEGYQHPENR